VVDKSLTLENESKMRIIIMWYAKRNKGKNEPRLIKFRLPDPITIYIGIAFVCLFALLLCFICSRGDLIEHYFFRDVRDTGMDFFHSIEYTRGRKPYELFNTLYPPLANLFFYIIYLMIPSFVTDMWPYDFGESIGIRGTNADLRTYQACLLAYLIFVIICVMLLFALIDYALEDEICGKSKWAAASIVLSYGCLTAIERGNIVILSGILVLIFVLFYRSENKVIKELALISLAISAGMKLYPALLGILLIKRKDWLSAVRTVIYGIASVVLPMFAFGGLSMLDDWLGIVTNFGASGTVGWTGTGVENILNNIIRCLPQIFSGNVLMAIFKIIAYLFVIFLFVSCFIAKKEWQSVLALTLPMVLLQSQGDYSICLFIPALVLFLIRENRVTVKNIIPFGGLMVLTVNIPVFYQYSIYEPRNTITQIALVVLAGWCIYNSVCCLVIRYKKQVKK